MCTYINITTVSKKKREKKAPSDSNNPAQRRAKKPTTSRTPSRYPPKRIPSLQDILPFNTMRKKPRAAVVILFSSIQSIHLYCGRPDQLQFLTHQINPRTRSAGFFKVLSSSFSEAFHPQKPFIAGLSTLPLCLLLPYSQSEEK